MGSILSLGVLISGRGSNLGAIIHAIEAGDLNAKIDIVISNKPDAKGLELAKHHEINHVVVDSKEFETRSDHEAEIVKVLQDHEVDLVVLAGYMRIIGETFITPFEGRLINIHPSLLPDFKGLNAQRQALEAGVSEAGCTVHFVTKEVDSGPTILQAKVAVLPGDTEESLSARILEKEHEILPQAIQTLAERKIMT